MRSTVMFGTGDVRSEIVPDPQLLTPNDAIVRVVAACVCGSDLWGYRGIDEVDEPRRMGHEAIGVVEQVGANVHSAKPGDFVILPLLAELREMPEACRHGCDASCDHCAFYDSDDAEGNPPAGGCQSSMLRVPDWANHTMVPVGISEAEIEKKGLIPTY